MNISISKAPMMDSEGRIVDNITVIVATESVIETAKDVLEDYQTIIKGLKEEQTK